MEGFERLETPLDRLPGESVITSNTSPFLIVATRTNTVYTEVDGTGAAHAQAARIIDLPVVAVGLGAGLVPPVHVFVLKSKPSLAVDAEIKVFVTTTGFDEEDFELLGSFGEISCQGTTGRTA